MSRSRPRRRALVTLALLLGAALTSAVPARAQTNPWTDVPDGYWDMNAINYVAQHHNWMQDYGSNRFRPSLIETREYLARAVVRAFAPNEPTDPNITFPDLPNSDPFYPYANVAVKLGWMTRPGGKFLPNDPVDMTDVHRALVLALGLRTEVNGLDAVHTVDGTKLAHPPGFAYLDLGMLLGLRFDHSKPALDVGPTTPMPRSEVAFSLYKATTISSWQLSAMTPLGTIELPTLSLQMQKVVEFGFQYVGYPYIWGGEWGTKTPSGYCCGYQSQGGFDCSGLMWWLLKAPDPTINWDNTKYRPYKGWTLNARTADQMAAYGKTLTYNQARPGDLMFYASSGTTVTHVDLYVGKGWALDSSGGGVTIMRVASGWFRDHFVHARNIMH